MRIISSIKKFLEILKENIDFISLGINPFWYPIIYYKGRISSRKKKPYQLSKVEFRFSKRLITLKLSAPYLNVFKGIFINREYDISSYLTFSPEKIVDLGANIGMATVYLSTVYPQADIINVEPDPRNLFLLEQNLNTNKVNAHIIKGAVGPELDKMSLRFDENPTCSSLDGTNMHDLSQRIDVDVFTIPWIMEKYKLDKIDLLKIDIEGAEKELLSRDNEWLSKVRAIVLEIHPNVSEEEIDSYLSQFNFTLRRLPRVSHEPVYLALKQS